MAGKEVVGKATGEPIGVVSTPLRLPGYVLLCVQAHASHWPLVLEAQDSCPGPTLPSSLPPGIGSPLVPFHTPLYSPRWLPRRGLGLPWLLVISWRAVGRSDSCFIKIPPAAVARVGRKEAGVVSAVGCCRAGGGPGGEGRRRGSWAASLGGWLVGLAVDHRPGAQPRLLGRPAGGLPLDT